LRALPAHGPEADHRTLRAGADEGGVRRHPVRAQRRDVAHGLDEVRLALTVGADERAHPRFQLEINLAVGAEVGEREGADVHAQSMAGRVACPPNSCRSAATAFIAGESPCRDANRAKSAAEITGRGTAASIASSTVHRPSPE